MMHDEQNVKFSFYWFNISEFRG